MKLVTISLKVALIASFATLPSCDLLGSCKSIGSRICLQKWEDGKTFYLIDKRRPEDDGGGMIDGTVTKIGWNDRYVFAKRYSTFRGDPDGWMVVNRETGWVDGPYDDRRISRSLSKLTIMAPEEAWNM